ncbi:MAG TPA: enoyl-CoA hydratase-related protein [Acidimicrobiales bacterium]|jgi:2-(1,2-epoxy-1,2-dihydrophenyl)acetyl-CoA isomerase|nr:enoyl-CoA hydratase-related protein [Acidimicrobiales bacterium]
MATKKAATGEDVLRRKEGGVTWITLNRPDFGNAITTSMREQIIAWLEEASADLAVRAVVLTGAGEKGFCTGADLRSTGPGPDRPEGAPARPVGEAARLIRTGWQRLISAVLDCEKPVVAAVNATAAGGGMHLALACDLVLAAEESKFIEVFVRRGIAPDAGGAYLLPRLIGPQRAKELFFFGDDVSATEAERLGLVNRVVPRAELADLAGEWAGRLATGPTVAIGMAKYLTNRSLESDRAAALWDEAVAQELVTGSEDCREGLAAFAERRRPVFKGW